MAIKTLQIIHAFLVLGLAAFAAVSFFQGPGFINNFNVSGDIFIYIVPTLAILGYFASKFLFKKEISKIKPSETLTNKLGHYQKATIQKFALIEGPAILAFLQFLNYGYTLYFTIGCTLLLYLASLKPRKSNIIQELGLNKSEIESL